MSASGEHNCACDCGDCDVSDGSEASYASDSSELPTWRGGGRRKGWSAPAPAPDSELSTPRTVKSIKGVAMRRILRLMCDEEKMLSWVSDRGNCLFMACAAVLHGNADAHALVRERSVREMEANPGAYLPFIEDSEDFQSTLQKDAEGSSVGWYGATASYRRGLQENHSSLPIR